MERRTDSCRVLARDEASARMLADACARAAIELARLLERSVPGGLVVQVDDSAMREESAPALHAGEVWLAAVPIGSSGESSLELGGGERISAGGYYAHEIAHHMATAMLFPGDTGASGDGYGSPLPDWLDEALGLLVEPPVDQRARLAALFEGERILALPLRRLLYMRHPAVDGARPGSPVRRVFYGQSLAFAQFIRARAGAGGFRRLVSGLRDNERQGELLTSLPGMPPDGGSLEQAWLAWLRERHDAAPAPGT